MRALTLASVLVALIPLPALAQEGRLSFELGGGLGRTSDMFHQDLTYPPTALIGGATSTTRLTLAGGSVGAARVVYRVAGPWLLVGEVSDGSTEYHYLERVVTSTGLTGLQERWGGARRSAVAVGVGRRATLGALPLSVEPEVGVAMQRLRVGRQVECVPTAPSLGGGGAPCIPSARWERTYSAPSVQAGLSLGYAILPRVTVQLHGAYSVGRMSTEEGFYEDLIPEADWMEAPKSQVVRTSQLSVGLRLAP